MKTRRPPRKKALGSAKPSAAGRKRPSRGAAFPVVGIGASAGGLESFGRLLKHLPAHPGMAFVFVQHLDPTHESWLAEILRTASDKIGVVEAREGMRIVPDRVYVIPPDMNLLLEGKVLHLRPRNSSMARYTPVDFFFFSLAAEQKNKAIGVVLSGTGSDGTAGMEAIKVEGGITFAQDEASAKYFGMPQSAISADVVDFVLPPEEIARRLVRLGRHPYVQLPGPARQGEGLGTEPRSPIRQTFALLKKSFGVDFSAYKFSTIDRRIRRRMALQTDHSLQDYLRRLRKDPEELRALFQDMFIGVTEFFRDPGLFEALTTTVYPALLRRRPSGTRVRIWVPGCSTGEEAYSIAISLLEYMGSRANRTSVQIFATDVNDEAIRKARVGFYGKHIAASVSGARLHRFFTKTEAGFQISKQVRDLCVFDRHDIVRDPPFMRMDLLSCRNLLIYLNAETQKKLIPVFHYALRPNGFLVLGPAESISGFSELFSLKDRRFHFYLKKAVSQRPHIGALAERLHELALAKPHLNPQVLRGDFELQKEAADHLILNHYAPAAVLVDGNMEVLHFRGHTGPYLEPAPGAASLNLLKMAREGLMQPLRGSLEEARKKNAVASRKAVRVEADGQERVVDIHVVPIKAPTSRDRAFLVLFAEASRNGMELSALAPARGKAVRGGGGDARVAQLKQELAATKAYLQSSLESQEASNAELRSLNEEIMSSNEELRSTTEELEASNEELESANEELSTLNEELQNRTRELAQAHSDISNLLRSMDLGMLLLDRDFRIRRFTATARSVLKLSDADLGRPLTRIVLPFAAPDLKKQVVEAMEKLKPVLAEVQAQNGRRYELQIRPYVGATNQIAGTVIAFTDISELSAIRESLREERLKRAGAEEAVRAGQERFRTVADSMLELISYIDSEQRYQFNNKSYERWYGIPVDHYKGRTVQEVLGDKIYAIVRPFIEKALAGESPSFEGYIPLEKLGRRYVHVDYIPRRRDSGVTDGFYVIIRDLTELKEAEEKARAVVENAPQGTIVHDREGNIVIVNDQAERMFGYSRHELIGQSVEVLMPERVRNAHLAQRQKYLRAPVARPMGTGMELYGRRKDGSEFPVEVTLSPVETSSGTMVISGVVDISERKQLAEQTRWATILEERARMARDVHDTLAQGFTGVILNLEMAEKACSGRPQEARNRIARARDVARASLEEARRSIQAFSSPLRVVGDLAGSIRGLVDRLSASTTTPVLFSLRGTPRALPLAAEENLLRIAEQALDNALEHSHASNVWIELSFDGNEAGLQVRDDGQGFDAKKAAQSMGLAGMRDRARLIGGTFDLDSKPGLGTRIGVRLPIAAAVRREASS